MRQKGRRRGVRRVRAYGVEFGMGKQQRDAVTGDLYPVRLMVQQRGGLVSEKWGDGGRDKEPDY